MTDRDEEARARLRERQGAGARYDSPAAPALDLLWARRGTAYFARKLNELADTEFDVSSGLPGWSRRHVVASVSYHARSLARLAEAAHKGVAKEALTEPESQLEDVEFGATLPVHALRHLFQHSSVHLNVAWRDLNDAAWEARVRSLSNELVSIRETPRIRAQEIWLRALDLRNGGSALDLPAELRKKIIGARGDKSER